MDPLSSYSGSSQGNCLKASINPIVWPLNTFISANFSKVELKIAQKEKDLPTLQPSIVMKMVPRTPIYSSKPLKRLKIPTTPTATRSLLQKKEKRLRLIISLKLRRRNQPKLQFKAHKETSCPIFSTKLVALPK